MLVMFRRDSGGVHESFSIFPGEPLPGPVRSSAVRVLVVVAGIMTALIFFFVFTSRSNIAGERRGAARPIHGSLPLESLDVIAVHHVDHVCMGDQTLFENYTPRGYARYLHHGKQ